MGMDGHFDQQLDDQTLMTPTFHTRPGFGGRNILFWRDFVNLRSLYDPESLSDWAKERYEVWGCLDLVCFGAQRLTGDANAFADTDGGAVPPIDLADNPLLSGTATWRGRLLGLTPTDRVVGGAAALSIGLNDLEGVLGFTGLESWPAGQSPGDVGSGMQWGDGDLHYGIHVQGNEFTQTGHGDPGLVTGIFSGTLHQEMTGVLERDDLAAGFGGKR